MTMSLWTRFTVGMPPGWVKLAPFGVLGQGRRKIFLLGKHTLSKNMPEVTVSDYRTQMAIFDLKWPLIITFLIYYCHKSDIIIYIVFQYFDIPEITDHRLPNETFNQTH